MLINVIHVCCRVTNDMLLWLQALNRHALAYNEEDVDQYVVMNPGQYTIGGTGVSSIWTTPSLWLIYRWERNARYEYLFLPFCKFEMITYGLSDCHVHSVYKYYWWNCFHGNRMQPRTTTNRRTPSFPSRLGRVPWSVPWGDSWTWPHGRDPSTCPRKNQPRKSSSASVQVPPSPCLFLGLTWPSSHLLFIFCPSVLL